MGEDGTIQELISNPAVQAGVAPFIVALAVTLALMHFRLGGLAVLAAFLTCTYFVAGFQLVPLTSLRKVFLLAIAASLVGLLVDFAFRPTRLGTALLGVAAAGAALWAFWPVIASKPPAEAWRLGGVSALAAGFTAVLGSGPLASDGVRAGSAALGFGLGVGVAAIIGASLAVGSQGIALGAGAGAFLLPQMIRGRKSFAGATFALTAMIAGALLAAGAMILAALPWHSVLLLAVAPAAARLPVPASVPVWLEATLCSLYTLVVAAAACALAWPTIQHL